MGRIVRVLVLALLVAACEVAPKPDTAQTQSWMRMQLWADPLPDP